MPRCARIKSFMAIYHVMVRSISEIDMFLNDDDKLEYIKILKEYLELFRFKLYAYCFMDNHAHFMIDANGADISKIMHSVNFKFAQHFNRKHKRHGHLFQDRFKSKIVEDEDYLYALTAYIHNNATDISDYKKCPENYMFSSLGVYLGIRKDPFGILDRRFLFKFFGKRTYEGRKNYYNVVMECNDIKKVEEFEFRNEKTISKNYRHILVRNVDPEKIIIYIMEVMDITRIKLITKNTMGSLEAKAMLIFLLRCLCNVKCSDICKIFGNMSQSRISSLCRLGVELYDIDKSFRGKIEKFIAINS